MFVFLKGCHIFITVELTNGGLAVMAIIKFSLTEKDEGYQPPAKIIIYTLTLTRTCTK